MFGHVWALFHVFRSVIRFLLNIIQNRIHLQWFGCPYSYVARMTNIVHFVWMVPLNTLSRKSKVLWTKIQHFIYNFHKLFSFFWILIDRATTLSLSLSFVWEFVLSTKWMGMQTFCCCILLQINDKIKCERQTMVSFDTHQLTYAQHIHIYVQFDVVYNFYATCVTHFTCF